MKIIEELASEIYELNAEYKRLAHSLDLKQEADCCALAIAHRRIVDTSLKLARAVLDNQTTTERQKGN